MPLTARACDEHSSRRMPPPKTLQIRRLDLVGHPRLELRDTDNVVLLALTDPSCTPVERRPHEVPRAYKHNPLLRQSPEQHSASDAQLVSAATQQAPAGHSSPWQQFESSRQLLPASPQPQLPLVQLPAQQSALDWHGEYSCTQHRPPLQTVRPSAQQSVSASHALPTPTQHRPASQGRPPQHSSSS
jgi:hypothetical protein